MKSYVRGVLGGILALLAAFGWTVTIAFAIAMKYGAMTKHTGSTLSESMVPCSGSSCS
jgi:hypothetical protein